MVVRILSQTREKLFNAEIFFLIPLLLLQQRSEYWCNVPFPANQHFFHLAISGMAVLSFINIFSTTVGNVNVCLTQCSRSLSIISLMASHMPFHWSQ